MASECAPDDGNVKKKKKRVQPPNVQFSPSKFKRIVSVVNHEMKDLICGKGFGGLLQFMPNKIDRHLGHWVMQKFNPNSVWCMFQIPNAGGDPPVITDDVARVKHGKLAREICGTSYDPNRSLAVSDVENGLDNGSLTGSLGLSSFFCCFSFYSILQH